ncbi:AraC family transcriptional regulator [Avibacterium sp. 20-15]|uniref:AraC family transcriptional regulator n=1 Tax=unclassified Avibacterium TaxID=2685287 RepID=UPI0020268FCB|nr:MULTISPECIES: AraC family transcriptional regulator [unclassified Avibacterium]MCW9733007.1 AraC family transcriptional regulator [Avibacterium sp. 20-15]URL05137.1 AraC family transcriptional regulator [Avibacterium sp. 20-132]
MYQDPWEKLASLIKRFTQKEGSFSDTALPALNLCRRNHRTHPVPCIYPLSLFVVVQGVQHVNFGNEIMQLAQGDAALTTLDLPVVSHVLQASQNTPYLSLRIELDVMLLRELAEQTDWQTKQSSLSDSLSVAPIDEGLLDAVVRYTALLDEPQWQPHLAPLIEREIAVRLLNGVHQPMLKRLLMQGSAERNIAKIIAYFNEHYTQKTDINQLAEQAHMSPSSFRQHFRKLTGVSPLQYQKQLRLQHARRLMFKENQDATTAAFAVGYESPTQFNREYARLFGEPPHRDIQRLKDNEMQFGRIV